MELPMGGSTNESAEQETLNLYRRPLPPLMVRPQIPVPPTFTPTVNYYYSRKAVQNICYIYRVVQKCKESSTGRNFKCLPEAQGWPEMHITAEELQTHFLKIQDDNIFSNTSLQDPQDVMFPSLPDLKKWQVGVAVCFSHYDVRTTGLVVGRFVWNGNDPPACFTTHLDNKCNPQSLALILLLQTPTNRLLLSSEVTDLEIEDMEAMTTRGEVYIQGISLLAVVATLIANVTYIAMCNPPKGKDDSLDVNAVFPVTYTFFNAIAFYCSVLSVVVMTAFIPIFGTARKWGDIFLSGSVPVVVGLISFYIAFIISAWTVMDFYVKPLAITLLGCSMVVYVYIWAIELMNGHIEHGLRVQLQVTPWQWYVKRAGRAPGQVKGMIMARFAMRIRFLLISISHLFMSRKLKKMSSFTHTIRMREQQAYLLGQY